MSYSGGASQWRACYQRGLPRLVLKPLVKQPTVLEHRKSDQLPPIQCIFINSFGCQMFPLGYIAFLAPIQTAGAQMLGSILVTNSNKITNMFDKFYRFYSFVAKFHELLKITA